MLFQSAEGEQNSCAAVILVSPVSNKGFESHPAGIQMTSKKKQKKMTNDRY